MDRVAYYTALNEASELYREAAEFHARYRMNTHRTNFAAMRDNCIVQALRLIRAARRHRVRYEGY